MAVTNVTPLQTVDEHSTSSPMIDAPIVFFDGVCGLCNGFVNFVLNRKGGEQIKFAPLQGETAGRILDAEDTENLHSVVFKKGDQAWRHSSAIVRIYWEVGGIWAVLGTLIWLVPKPLRDFGYKLIAKFRYQLFGKHESCRMPRPGEQDRMLP